MITQSRMIARSKARKLSVKSKPKPRFNLTPNKCWGKPGHKWVNLIAQATRNAQKFNDEKLYAL